MPQKILTFLASRTFLFVIVGIFVFEATWIALTGRYPGAFDENFHFGLIQLYAKHWLPFLDAQPQNAEAFGAVARDPSYLYHYLMSFPYRIISAITDSQPAQIIVLRLINVALATWGILVYAKILRRSKLSKLTQNAILLLFTAVPILSLLASQINYDNLLLVLFGYAILWTLQSLDLIKTGVLSGRLLLKILVVSLMASLTKYAFLPLLAGIATYLTAQIFLNRKQLFSAGLSDYWHRGRKALVRWPSAFLIILLLVLGGLFWQRFGINTVRYHTPLPDCSQVITVEECLSYAPWGRDHNFAQNHTDWKRENVVVYSGTWIRQMVREMFFTVYGAFFPGTTVVDYKTGEPLPFMIILGWTLLISGVVAVVLYARKLWREPMLQLFTTVIMLYVGALFYQNYKAYVETAVPVAIHGRYLLPVLPLIGVIYFRAFSLMFSDVLAKVKTLASRRNTLLLSSWVVMTLVLIQGGGFVTHIVRSNQYWFWQQSQAAQNINDAARNILKPIVIENKL